MQTIAKWLMAGAVSYAILQSGLFYTFLSPDNFTLEQNQYPEAAAVEDEKEVASDSRIKPHHGINNKSGKQIANCATYMFPPVTLPRGISSHHGILEKGYGLCVATQTYHFKQSDSHISLGQDCKLHWTGYYSAMWKSSCYSYELLLVPHMSSFFLQLFF